MVGFSGSGKTTLISLLAGLIAPGLRRGAVQGQARHGAGPERAVVFQNYSLLPWLTRARQRRAGRGCRAPRTGRRRGVARRWASTSTWWACRMPRTAGRRTLGRHAPAGCSGARAGDRTGSAAAGRAAVGPGRADARASCRTRSRRSGSASASTVVLVTNDVDEALLLADRVIALTPGDTAGAGAANSTSTCRVRASDAQSTQTPAYQALRARDHADTCSPWAQSAARSGGSQVALPDIVPLSAFDPPPRAVREAQKRKAALDPGKYVEFFEIIKTYPDGARTVDRRGRLQPRHRAWRVRVADRTFGLRQVDRAVHGGGPDRGVARAASCSTDAWWPPPDRIAAWCSRRPTCCPG